MVRVFCPAKLNLFLSVGPPDQIGYHPLRTIFQSISFGDELLIRSANEFSIECDWDELPAENTLTKVLRMYNELYTVPKISIKLIKKIPEKSGLGGGSSDAAGLLRLLYFLDQRGIDSFAKDVALAVGADVPFFLTGGRAFGEGYGERLTALDDREVEWYVLLRPKVGMNTAEAFRILDGSSREFLTFDESRLGHNDFHLVAPRESMELVERLKGFGARYAMMTGSGSAVFGLFESELRAQEVAEKFDPAELELVCVCHSLRRKDSLRIEVIDEH